MASAHTRRVVAHVDLDAFYAQVEVKQNPHLKGKPVAVVQYNPYGDLKTVKPTEDRIANSSNGSLIAVSYEARAMGVKRNMRGDEARKLCPQLQLVQVPTAHGKADLTLYRQAGKQVMGILSQGAVCERASIDECYLDITAEATKRLQNNSGMPQAPVNIHQVHVAGQEGAEKVLSWWTRPAHHWGEGERLLAQGAAIVAELRAAVQSDLGFSCSAGIAHNKILSKLASGLHKPAQQTVVTFQETSGLLHPLPIGKLRQLGGKFGEEIHDTLKIMTVGELAAVPLPRLASLFGEATASWLQQLALGLDTDPVKPRMLPKSCACGKTFRGHKAIRDLKQLQYWMGELGGELEERLNADRDENGRTPQLLSVSFTVKLPGRDSGAQHVSRSVSLHNTAAASLADSAVQVVGKWVADKGGWSVSDLYLSASGFVMAPTGASTITRFLTRPEPSKSACPVSNSRQLSPTATNRLTPPPCSSHPPRRSTPQQTMLSFPVASPAPAAPVAQHQSPRHPLKAPADSSPHDALPATWATSGPSGTHHLASPDATSSHHDIIQHAADTHSRHSRRPGAALQPPPVRYRDANIDPSGTHEPVFHPNEGPIDRVDAVCDKKGSAEASVLGAEGVVHMGHMGPTPGHAAAYGSYQACGTTSGPGPQGPGPGATTGPCGPTSSPGPPHAVRGCLSHHPPATLGIAAGPTPVIHNNNNGNNEHACAVGVRHDDSPGPEIGAGESDTGGTVRQHCVSVDVGLGHCATSPNRVQPAPGHQSVDSGLRGAQVAAANVPQGVYQAADIDMSVLAELPPEIQQEIRASLRQGGGPRTAQLGHVTHVASGRHPKRKQAHQLGSVAAMQRFLSKKKDAK